MSRPALYIFHLMLLLAALCLAPAGRGGLFAQNLVPNASFEDVNICTEYTAPCAPCAWVAVSPAVQKMGYQYNSHAADGHHYVALPQAPLTRVYVQTRLLCPLQPGAVYIIRLYIGRDNFPLQAGIRFDTGFLFKQSAQPLEEAASILFSEKDRQKTILQPGKTWYVLEKRYTATKYATHLVLGNFAPMSPGGGRKGLLLVDSISITPLQAAKPCSEADSIKAFLYRQRERHTIPAAYTPEKRLVQTLGGRNGLCDTLVFKDDLFLPGSKTLNPAYQEQVQQALRAYRRVPGNRIRLIGHASKQASARYNEIISYDMARALAAHLVYEQGFSFDDFEITGMGNRQPRYDTASTANNRVEMVLCRPSPENTGPQPVAAAAPDTLVIPDILFRFNRSELNTALYGTLDSLIRKIPRDGSVQLQITGHTDNAGTAGYNQALSERRAQSLALYLQQHGLEKEIRQVSGAGESRPVAGNDTPEGRRRNRRVEIIIYHSAD